MSQWRVSDMALGLLTALAVLAAWEGYALNHKPETSGCGGDFSQFYTAGAIVLHGDVARFYDQPYFRHFQDFMRTDPLRSHYPPSIGLVMAPLALLPYSAALGTWWALQAMCLAACGVIFYRESPLPKPWRINMLVALAALLPVWVAIGIGHLSPMLLLILTGGLTLHRHGRPLLAGLLLSLFAVKPQLMAGLAIWMLLRRDARTLAGIAVGGAVQFAAVAVTLGIQVWFDYLRALPHIAAMTREYTYSPLFEQSLTGIARNLLDAAGLSAYQVPVMRIVYALTTAVAAVALCRVVTVRRPFGGKPGMVPISAGTVCSPAAPKTYEYACGVLFMTIFPPYFLVYDQTLLAIPLVMLWASPAWRWGVLLFAVSAVPLANLSFAMGFSVASMISLGIMVALAREVSKAPARAAVARGVGSVRYR
jgi:hypothetical protein